MLADSGDGSLNTPFIFTLPFKTAARLTAVVIWDAGSVRTLSDMWSGVAVAGTPAAPALSGAIGSATGASVTIGAVPTATSYAVVAKRTGSADVASAGTVGLNTVSLAAGKWALHVTATSPSDTSAAAVTEPLVVGTPQAPTSVTATGGVGTVTLGFQ